MGLFVSWHTVQQGAEVAKQLAGKRGPELKLQGEYREEEDAWTSRLSLPRYSLPGFNFSRVKLRINIFNRYDGSNSTAECQFALAYLSSLFIFPNAAQQDSDPQAKFGPTSAVPLTTAELLHKALAEVLQWCFILTLVKVQEVNKNLPVSAPGTRSDASTKFLEKMSVVFCLQDSLKAGFRETCIQKVTLKLTLVWLMLI